MTLRQPQHTKINSIRMSREVQS